jgi:hypothetical protein
LRQRSRPPKLMPSNSCGNITFRPPVTWFLRT